MHREVTFIDKKSLGIIQFKSRLMSQLYVWRQERITGHMTGVFFFLGANIHSRYCRLVCVPLKLLCKFCGAYNWQPCFWNYAVLPVSDMFSTWRFKRYAILSNTLRIIVTYGEASVFQFIVCGRTDVSRQLEHACNLSFSSLRMLFSNLQNCVALVIRAWMNESIWGVCGIILTGVNRNTRIKICPIASFSVRKLKRIGLGWNPFLWGGRPAIKPPEPWHILNPTSFYDRG